MRRWLTALSVVLACCCSGAPGRAETVLMVGWCAGAITSAAAPLAVAQKMGWFAAAGFRLELYPLGGSAACAQAVASGSISYALASIEPLVAMGPRQGGPRTFYTAYQGNIYGLAVPDDSPIRALPDLRGKRVGVTSMSSGGVTVARALAGSAGLDPQHDITLVEVGEGAHAAAMLAQEQVDALSLYDVQYAMVEAAGVKLRMMDNSAIARFPSNGFIAMDYTLAARYDEAVELARGYAMGTVFTIANPEAAVRILHEIWPQTVPHGMDEAIAVRQDLATLDARIPNWKLEAGGVSHWGESSLANYDAYVAFLVKNGAAEQSVPAETLVSNALIPAVNAFDATRVAKLAAEYRP
jgi:NitT/TauT family transport system substrate-binding protein